MNIVCDIPHCTAKAEYAIGVMYEGFRIHIALQCENHWEDLQTDSWRKLDGPPTTKMDINCRDVEKIEWPVDLTGLNKTSDSSKRCATF